jgi:energy-converting hydrogenase Eha subunit G
MVLVDNEIINVIENGMLVNWCYWNFPILAFGIPHNQWLLQSIAGCMMMMILVRCVDPRIDLFGI